MTASLVIRRSAAALLAVALGLATLPGCGSQQAGNKDEKKAETPNPNPPNPNPTDPNTTPKPPSEPPKPKLGPIEPAAATARDGFLRDVGSGMVKADVLSAAFLRSVGKPLILDSDRAKGYSEDAATSWLRRVGEGVSFFPSLKQDQVGDSLVYIRGSFTAQRLGKEAAKGGGYCLRLIKEGGAWKVDWFSLSSVDTGDVVTTAPPTPDGMAQSFAAVAFAELAADLNGMPKDERLIVLAAAMTPELRAAWAPPFEQDRKAGYDCNLLVLGTKAVEIGGGASALTATRTGDLPEFKVEFTKPAGKKTCTVKLAKGAAPHVWLVSEVPEVK
jgi:hypothetical protein